MSKLSACNVLAAIGGVVQAELRAGCEVVLPGIGKLVPIERQAAEGRNPRTGEAITIAAKRTAKLRPAKALLDHLAAGR